MRNYSRKCLSTIILSLAILIGKKAMALAPTSTSAFDFSFTTIDGNSLPLSSFKGKVVLLVNTASRCGFTSQYAALQQLWRSYRDRGLVVLGVPSNDFGGQEPGTNTEIKMFCEVNFDVDFNKRTSIDVDKLNCVEVNSKIKSLSKLLDDSICASLLFR